MNRSLAAVLLGGAAWTSIAGGTPALAQTVEERPLKPTYGTINPFYGTISPFYGTINPFYGTITSFWGTINPFYGTITSFWGTINPFYGTITSFGGGFADYGDIGRYWEQFGVFWKDSAPLWDDPARAADLGLRLNEMIVRTEALWGPAVTNATGKTFLEAVAKPLFTKFGVDPANPATLQALTAEQRAQFFLEWYDGLMGYSGTDRIDHWMRTVNWTPSITQQQGSGSDSIIGLLDATATGDPDIFDNITYSGGGSTTVNGHGIGVASLMVAAHDRAGVMGIAPNARVVAYNPFDSTETASWSAVKDGILALASRNASVINMSLGVPGYTLHPDWKQVFSDSSVDNATDDKVAFVMAAGNDGKTQTQDVLWDWSKAPALVVVGSVDVAGNISSFSNRPGDACLLDGVKCHERNRLKNIFMVAPGELMLLPDGKGGFVRRSGTSFAAPLVSGAITLLHDRWPWLAKYPRESIEIILRSARDLGEPGVDPVYGHGMLDVAASQAPLSFGSLKFYEMKNGVPTEKTPADIKAAGIQTTWEAEGIYFQLYEKIGGTHRDFSVPVSSLLAGKVGTLTGASEYFQHFITSRMKDWITGQTTSFTDVATLSVAPNGAGWQFAISGSSPEVALGLHGDFSAPHSSVRLTSDRGLSFSAGFGEGAMTLGSQTGFGLSSDYGKEGGVNPLLGLASGGAFAAVDLPLSRATSLSAGLTSQRLDHSRARFRTAVEQAAFRGLDPFQAEAINVKVAHQASDALSLSASYAKVRERNGLLGVQSREESDLRGGAVSDTATLAASLRLNKGFTLAVSATAGRTKSAGEDEQGFATAGHGVLTSAFAVATTKQGVLGSSDMLRLSIAQPLHIERGELSYSSVEVIDRKTGELGTVAKRFDVAGGPRTYTGELLYAAPLLNTGEVGLFGRADFRPSDGGVDDFVIGTRLSIGF
jgi:hypothetical protein